MKLLRPLMGARRQRQLDAAVATFSILPSGKIPREQHKVILSRFASGESTAELAVAYGVSMRAIYAIRAKYKIRSHEAAPT
jgi:Mor family transcriptional regulator